MCHEEKTKTLLLLQKAPQDFGISVRQNICFESLENDSKKGQPNYKHKKKIEPQKEGFKRNRPKNKNYEKDRTEFFEMEKFARPSLQFILETRNK